MMYERLNNNEEMSIIIEDFLADYIYKKDKCISDEEWLQKKINEYCPNIDRKELMSFCKECCDNGNYICHNLDEIDNAEKEYGWNSELWLYNNVLKYYNLEHLEELENANAVLEKIRNWQKSLVIGNKNCFDSDIWDENGILDINKRSSLNQDLYNNNFCININDLAIKIGRNAYLNGIGNVAIVGNITIAKKTETGVSYISRDDIMQALRNKGADVGVKNALSGALKVGVERNLIPILGKTASAASLEAVAYFAVENSKVMWQFANNEIPLFEALDRASRISVSCAFSVQGMLIGASMGAVVPVVGPIVGGMVGKFVGEEIARKGGVLFYDAATHLAWCAADVALSEWELLENTVKVVNKNLLRNLEMIVK